MADDLLENFEGAVEGQVCSVSKCTYNPIGRLEGRALCGLHYERRARLMTVDALEAAIAETDNRMNEAKLRDALVEVAEFEEVNR